MAHAISSPQKSVGQGQPHPDQRAEKYSDTGLLCKLSDRALVVCHIVLADNGRGTGFLIGKDLIMTNNHVLDSLETARGAKALFFYTTHSKPIEVDLNPDAYFHTSETPDPLGFKPIKRNNLDFTIVAIKSHPKITEISHLAFSIFGTDIPQKQSHANIIHHPLDQGSTYQKVSFRENLVKELAIHTIHYTTATMPGSSGAPVMDDEGNLIALHRATCTHILKALLKEKMLTALLQELFGGTPFTQASLTLNFHDHVGRCATIDGSPLYVFSDGELKGQYYHEGKTASLFRLINTQHPSPKKWALDFINARLLPEEQLADYHKECNTAVPIKAIHDYLKSVGLLDQVQLRYQESQKNLPSLLKESYLQKCGSLPLVLTNAAFPIESFFTQLSIVSHASQEKKEEEVDQRDPNMVEKDSLREIYARLCTAEKAIEIHNLFDEKTRRVLVLGRAGIGKSTLCQKIAYDWASGTLFDQKFSLVYHIKLRDFNSQDKILGDPHVWMSQMIAKSCYAGAHQEKILQELKTNPEKILLIFDGWDEASNQLMQALEAYLLNTQVHYLVTSRPGVTSKIHNNFDLIVENMGFTRTQVRTYSEKFFAHTQCAGLDAFLKMLHSRSNLFTIAHVPIQLQILCTLWHKGEQDFPQTLTPLFSKIVRHLFEWEQNKNPQKKEIAPLKRLFLYQALGEIALKGLESKQLIISDTLVVNALIEKSLEDGRFEKIRRQDLISTGLVKECGTDDALYFLHLTYQEYCIAHYISSLPQSSLDKKQAQDRQRAFIQTYRYQPHFHLVIRMLAGCMWEASKDLQTMELFFEWLYSGHTDLIGAYQTELVLSCLDECRSEELEKRIWEKYKLGDFVGRIMEREATRDCLSRLMSLSTPAFTQVAQHLDKVGNQEKKNTEFLRWFFDHVQQYANETRFPLILGMVQKALCDQSHFVRDSAAGSLGELVAHAGKENIHQILVTLLKALIDQNPCVRSSAVKALANLAAHVKKENIPQFLNSLQKALSDYDWIVRGKAAEALGNLAAHVKKENIPQFLNSLQKALSDKDSSVCSSAAKALGELAAYAGKENITQIFNELLKAMVKALGRLEIDVLRSATQAIGKLAAYAGRENIPQILHELLKAMDDQECDVRSAVHCSAAKALGELAAHAARENITQILNILQKVMSDQDSWVCSSAAEALGKLAAYAGKENISQILNILQKAMSCPDAGAAAQALGKLAAFAEKENISLIVNILQKGMCDPDSYVRNSAAQALGKLAAHAGKENIPQIFNALQKGMCDPDSYVRNSAAQALGKLAAHAGKENIPQIFNALQKGMCDPDSCVRSSAARGLGELAAHAGKENIPQILNSLQKAQSDQKWIVRRDAVEALRMLVAHAGKENITQILNILQTTLSDQEECMRRLAAQAILSLKTEWLLSIFASQPSSHPKLNTLIFEHFINQSIPLYCVENSMAYSIHTRDTCYEACNLKQLRLLSNRCAALLTNTWTESAELENAKEIVAPKETCVVM